MKLSALSTPSHNALFFGEKQNTSSKENQSSLYETPATNLTEPSAQEIAKKWSPLTKLALATAAVIKATALSYLAYNYATSQNDSDLPTSSLNVIKKNVKLIQDFSSTPNLTTATNNHTDNIKEESTFEPRPIENQFSENIQSSIPGTIAFGLTATVVIAAGGIFAYFKSKSELADSSQITPNDAKEKSTPNSPIKEEKRKTGEEKAQTQQEAEARQQELETQKQQDAQAEAERLKLEAQKSAEEKRPDTPLKPNLKFRVDSSIAAFENIHQTRKAKTGEQEPKEHERLHQIEKIKTQYESYFNINKNEISLEEFKSKINEFSKLLMEMVNSKHQEIHELIYPGFVQLLSLSSRSAMEVAIECLSIKSINRVKITKVAFTEMIKKYQSVKNRYEKLSEAILAEDQEKDYEESLERYQSEILKQAIRFAKECRTKEVRCADQNIQSLDPDTFSEILSLLYRTDYGYALKLIDLFIDIRIQEDKSSTTIQEFHEFIISLLEEDSDLLKRYTDAYTERSYFNPKKIIARINLFHKIEDCFNKESLDIPKAVNILIAHLGNDLIEADDIHRIFSVLLKASPLYAMTLVKHCLDLYYKKRDTINQVKKNHCITFANLGIMAIEEKTGSKLTLNKKTAENFKPREYAKLFLRIATPKKTPQIKNTPEMPLVIADDFNFRETKAKNEDLAWKSVQQLVKNGDVKNKEVLDALSQLYLDKPKINALHFHLMYLLEETGEQVPLDELKENRIIKELFYDLYDKEEDRYGIYELQRSIERAPNRAIAIAMVKRGCINNEKKEFLDEFQKAIKPTKSTDLSVS